MFGAASARGGVAVADGAELEEPGFTSLSLCAGRAAAVAIAAGGVGAAGVTDAAKCSSHMKELGANGSKLVPGSVQPNM